jgi:phosphatidylglycerol:prolipoprotein diacylglycerol transferase
MYNDWLKIGPVTIHGYGVMIAIGVLAAFWLSERNAKKLGLDSDKIDNMIFFILIFGYACAKLLYCIVEYKQFLTDPLSVLGSGGWVVYGGILGGILAAWLYCRKNNWDFMTYANLLFPSLALGQGFGRIGCFFAGCCYGKAALTPFSVTFPTTSLCPVGTPVIPTQLIMSAGDFLLFAFLQHNLFKGKHPEDTAAYYAMFYSVGRFLIEFLRGDERGAVGPLSTSQFISIFIFLFGAWLLYRRQQKTGIVE